MSEPSPPPASLVGILLALRADDDVEFERNLNLLGTPKFRRCHDAPNDSSASTPINGYLQRTAPIRRHSHVPLHLQNKAAQQSPAAIDPLSSSSYLSSLATQFNDPNHFKVVKALFACPNLAAIPRGSDGAYPLHIAACIGDELLGRFIAMAYPEAATTQNAKGKIPLHFAAREGNIGMVQYLLHISPDSAKIATNKKKLALHFAAAEGFDDVCKVLLDVYPDGASQKTSKGKLPLHFASRKGSTECLDLLLSAFPGGSTLLDWEDSPPLHVALREGREDAAIRLIEQCPDVLKVRNICGEFPLSIAVGISSLSLLSRMINLWPGACKYVLQSIKLECDFERWSWSQIELLLLGASGTIQGSIDGLCQGRECHGERSEDVNFDSVEGESESSSDSDGDVICCRSHSLRFQIDRLIPCQDHPKSLPLHAALHFANNDSFIKAVMKKCPDLVKRPDIHGRYPLHIAAARSDLDMVEIVEMLLESYPCAALKRDVNGMLPLHIAICKKNNPVLVKKILLSNPPAAVRRCEVNNAYFKKKRPLYLAVDHGCGIDIVYMLLRADPNLAMYGSSKSTRIMRRVVDGMDF